VYARVCERLHLYCVSQKKLGKASVTKSKLGKANSMQVAPLTVRIGFTQVHYYILLDIHF
jgi:hypothetical protein